MTHTGPMPESAGEFTATERGIKCHKCGQPTAKCETWESSDGAYEDYKYTCQSPACGYVWWVDGIDS